MNNKSMHSTAATPETRLSLYKNAKRIIETTSPILKEHILTKEMLDESIEKKYYRIFEALLSVSIYLSYVTIKLAVILKSCLRPSFNYERRFNLKRINCSILEAYKHLYGYGKKKTKSLWILKIKSIIGLIEDIEFRNDYIIILNRIEEFGKNNVTNLEQRDLSFHYDLDPLLVYNMLRDISEEKEAQRMILFMDLLQEAQLFTVKYLKKHTPSINITNKDLSKYSFPFSDFDIFGDKKKDLNLILKKSIENNSSLLDSFCSKQKIPKLLKQNFKDLDNKSSVIIDDFFEIQQVIIHFLYIYIDLATASRNFIKSDFSIEKQLSMSQINTIVFEGYNKIYGLNDGTEKSFWKLYVRPVVFRSDNKELYEEFKFIEEELDILKVKINSFREIRQLSVHLEQGVPKVYSMLHNLNPIKEFSKVEEMLNSLNRLLGFMTKCIYSINERRLIHHKKEKESTDKIIDNAISILRKFSYNVETEKNIKLLEKFKSEEFLDEIIHKLFK